MLSRQRWNKAHFIMLALPAMAGCRAGEGPFLQVQFCLTKAAGPDELKRVLREIARDEGMEFSDRSADTTEECSRWETACRLQ
jgi:hypothetical protein